MKKVRAQNIFSCCSKSCLTSCFGDKETTNLIKEIYKSASYYELVTISLYGIRVGSIYGRRCKSRQHAKTNFFSYSSRAYMIKGKKTSAPQIHAVEAAKSWGPTMSLLKELLQISVFVCMEVAVCISAL